MLNVDAPPSQLNWREYEATGHREIATFVSQEDAEHIAMLHNRWVDDAA